MEAKIPKEVKEIAKILIKHHYQAYLVGGCVRDILIGREPKDWDVATSTRPEEIQNLFPTASMKINSALSSSRRHAELRRQVRRTTQKIFRVSPRQVRVSQR